MCVIQEYIDLQLCYGCRIFKLLRYLTTFYIVFICMISCTVNPRYSGLIGREGGKILFIADVRYIRMKRYSRKYTIGFIANTRHEHTNPKRDYIKVFILVFYFK
jgi:hypothetical protein